MIFYLKIINVGKYLFLEHTDGSNEERKWGKGSVEDKAILVVCGSVIKELIADMNKTKVN